MNWHSGIKVALLLATLAFYLFEFILHRQSVIFREITAASQTLWVPPVCFAVWCGSFLLLTFNRNDFPLIGLLLVAVIAYYVGYPVFCKEPKAITLLTGMTLGKGAMFLLKSRKLTVESGNSLEIRNAKCEMRIFLSGLVLLLAFTSCWNLEMLNRFYYGPRWVGPWDNPNDYGILMSAGVTLAIGLLAASPKFKVQSPEYIRSQEPEVRNQNWLLQFLCSFAARLFGERRRPGCRSPRLASNTKNVHDEAFLTTREARVLPIILIAAVLMMGTGLVMSYSRGAWLGTTIGLLHLAKAYGKFNWRRLKLFLLFAFGFLLLIICLLWNTPRTAPWYFQRLDFSRGSVQHRVAAWKAGFEIMRDHPFGVGWNKTVEIYQEHYSPPANGAAAITTNDYLMLGTQLGIPALLCFLTYVALCFGAANWWRKWRRKSLTEDYALPASDPKFTIQNSEFKIKAACRAAALSLLVAFWFDDGLFQLPTAAVFWILLELGASNSSPNEK